MKKLIVIIAAILASIILFSCKVNGPAGPAGAAADSAWQAVTYRKGVNNFFSFYDARLYQQYPTSTYGDDTDSYVGVYNSMEKRFLVQVVLPALPTGAVIKKATISIKRSSYFLAAGTLTFYEIMQVWGELSTTWNNSLGATPWTTAGGSAGTTAISDAVTLSSAKEEFVIWNLDINWVKKCYNNTTNGIVLKDDTVSGNKDFVFYTSDNAVISDRPIITVYYAME